MTVGEKLPLTTFEDHELFMLVVVEIIIFMSSMKTEMTKDLLRACRGTLCERRYVVTELKMLANIRRAGVQIILCRTLVLTQYLFPLKFAPL